MNTGISFSKKYFARWSSPNGILRSSTHESHKVTRFLVTYDTRWSDCYKLRKNYVALTIIVALIFSVNCCTCIKFHTALHYCTWLRHKSTWKAPFLREGEKWRSLLSVCGQAQRARPRNNVSMVEHRLLAAWLALTRVPIANRKHYGTLRLAWLIRSPPLSHSHLS